MIKSHHDNHELTTVFSIATNQALRDMLCSFDSRIYLKTIQSNKEMEK